MEIGGVFHRLKFVGELMLKMHVTPLYYHSELMIYQIGTHRQL